MPTAPGLKLKLLHPQREIAVDLELAAGSHTALIGHNGAGKSTILQAITGTLRDSPVVSKAVYVDLEIDGRDFSALAVHKRNIAYVGQNPVLFQHLNVLDNVAYGLRASGVSKPVARDQAQAMLQQMSISELAFCKVQELSGGQAQKVALARALVKQPRLLLLDEPFSALDVSAAAQLREFINIHCAGITLLLVTHDLLDVWTLCDSVLSLGEGKILQHSQLSEFLSVPTGEFAANLTGQTWVKLTALDAETLKTEQGVQLKLADGACLPTGNHVFKTGSKYLALLDPASIWLDFESNNSEFKPDAGVFELSAPRQLGHRIVRYLGEVPLLLENVASDLIPESGATFGGIKVSKRMKLINIDSG